MLTSQTLGLTGVPTPLLKRALTSLHRNELQAPLTINGLALIGLQDAGPMLLSLLRGLDSSAVRAVLVAVLAERMNKT